MTHAGESSKGGKSWLKYGCFGCLGAVLLLILIVAGVLAAAKVGARSEKVEEQTLAPDLPVVAVAPGPDTGELGEFPLGVSATERPGHEGTVVLDLSGADFEVVPGAPGDQLRVEATYDKSSYELEEDLQTSDNAPWVYTVRFRMTGSGVYALLKRFMGGASPKARIVLPVDVPLALDVKMVRGGLEMDLGGLWLETADLDLEQGGFQLDFSKPLHAPMERLSISGSMGGSQLSWIGNASPRNLDVDFSMGGMQLDLRGQWMVDSDISITTSNAGAEVQLPTDVGIEGLSGHERRIDPASEIGRPILRFTTSHSGGELRFE